MNKFINRAKLFCKFNLFGLAGFSPCIVPMFTAAQENKLEIPAEVEHYIAKNSKSCCPRIRVDLNYDKTRDFILL